MFNPKLYILVFIISKIMPTRKEKKEREYIYKAFMTQFQGQHISV
jgi:hypothetical protein